MKKERGKPGALEVDEEKSNGQRRERGSVRNRQRLLKGVLVVEAERWMLEREKIRGRSLNKSIEVPSYVIDDKYAKKFQFYFC
jgi:hypothetical protein